MLYEMSVNKLHPVKSTTFAEEKILERAHLQAAIRDNIAILDADLLVVAEEFGEFQDANRRIDLLCVDRRARLVVVELKRTEDGGHMELQALRYAAMISVMTFEDLVGTYAKHLRALGDADADKAVAREKLLDFFETDLEEDGGLSSEVRIILASANFSQEVTTTVLWLNDQYGADIRCVRLSPYRHGDQVLLDVQQVIPLPEAAELTVKLKRQKAAAKVVRESNRDLTKYEIVTGTSTSGPLAKRNAVLAMVKAVHAADVPISVLAGALSATKFRSVAGELSGEELWSAFSEEHAQGHRRNKWFVNEPFHEEGRTWLLYRSWGTNTESCLVKLGALAPSVQWKAHVDPLTTDTEDD